MIEKEILKYCEKHKNEEAGGIIKAGFFMPLENISTDKTNFFEFELEDWQDVTIVVHSHPNSTPFLSPYDRVMQIITGVDWWVVHDNKIHKYPYLPLLRGREFEYGQSDCGTLIEDAFTLMGIDLGRAERVDMQSDADQGVVIKRLKRIGFYQVKELLPGDVIVTSSQEEGNHLALFIDDTTVLHHAFNQLSKRISYNYVLQKRTHSIWRHKSFKPGMIQAVLNDIEASNI